MVSRGARRMTFEEASKVFKACFPCPRWSAGMFDERNPNEISVWAFPERKNGCLRFHMWKVEEWHGDVYYVEFIIYKDAWDRWDLIQMAERVIDRQPALQRQFSHWTYYADNHWQTRRPAWNAETLKEDIESMKAAVASLDMGSGNTDENDSGIPPVGIGCSGVLDLLGRSLSIPDYQRAYCWTENNVLRLLEDLSTWHKKHEKDGKEYHLGTVILKRQDDSKYLEVIDGQQRIITLGLLAAFLDQRGQLENVEMDIALGSNNETKAALEGIEKAKATIHAWTDDLDLSQTVVSVVEIGAKERDDLSFNFFNHLNSSGVPLTDYELLKGHHLRYIKDDSVAQIMDKRWRSLDAGRMSGLKEKLLHKCLFRIRKWLAQEWFASNADGRETHDLFHEFTLGFEPPSGFCTSYKEVAIDSLISGGLEFFDYVERYRLLFTQFIRHDAIKTIGPLSWWSYGTLHEAIVALAFLFYCKFGDIYLRDAVYAISWNVSHLRTMGQVRRSYLGDKAVFHEAATAISRATHESEAIGKLLDKDPLSIDENYDGEAGRYWLALHKCAKCLEGDNAALLNGHYNRAFEQNQPKKN